MNTELQTNESNFKIGNAEQDKKGKSKSGLKSKIKIGKNPELMKRRIEVLDAKISENYNSYLLVDVIETPIPPSDGNSKRRARQLRNRSVTQGKTIYNLVLNSFQKYSKARPWMIILILVLACTETGISFQGLLYILPDALGFFGKYGLALIIPALLAYTAGKMASPIVNELFYK